MGEPVPRLREYASSGQKLACAQADPRLQRQWLVEPVTIGGTRGSCGRSEVSHTISISIAELVGQGLALALGKRLDESQSLCIK